jgi:hypothetical protein
MTKDEIILMAREAGGFIGCAEYAFVQKDLERFANLVAVHEREECAKVADKYLMDTSALLSMPPKSSAAWSIANAIRAREQA